MVGFSAAAQMLCASNTTTGISSKGSCPSTVKMVWSERMVSFIRDIAFISRISIKALKTPVMSCVLSQQKHLLGIYLGGLHKL